MAKIDLSALLSDVRGTVGRKVFTRSSSGPVVRRPAEYRFPVTPAQRVMNDNFAAVLRAYKGLSRDQAMQWNRYAQTLTRHNPVNGTTYSPTGQQAFVELGLKFLQIHPGGLIPQTPPTAPFAGDTITVRAEGAAGQVLFLASGPNTASAQTELLLQRLPTPQRKPSATYRSQGFVPFAAGALSHAVAAAAGFYAPAYRFVNLETGQRTPLVILEVVEVR